MFGSGLEAGGVGLVLLEFFGETDDVGAEEVASPVVACGVGDVMGGVDAAGTAGELVGAVLTLVNVVLLFTRASMLGVVTVGELATLEMGA